MRDQELVLRFLALLHEGSNYQPPMVTFLNTYMGKKKEFSDQEAAIMSSEFRGAIDLIHESIGSRAFRPLSGRSTPLSMIPLWSQLPRG